MRGPGWTCPHERRHRQKPLDHRRDRSAGTSAGVPSGPAWRSRSLLGCARGCAADGHPSQTSLPAGPALQAPEGLAVRSPPAGPACVSLACRRTTSGSGQPGGSQPLAGGGCAVRPVGSALAGLGGAVAAGLMTLQVAFAGSDGQGEPGQQWQGEQQAEREAHRQNRIRAHASQDQRSGPPPVTKRQASLAWRSSGATAEAGAAEAGLPRQPPGA